MGASPRSLCIRRICLPYLLLQNSVTESGRADMFSNRASGRAEGATP